MTTAKQTPKPVFIRVRIEFGESEYFSYKFKNGEAEVNMCVTEDQLHDIRLDLLIQGLLPFAVLKYQSCVPEED